MADTITTIGTGTGVGTPDYSSINGWEAGREASYTGNNIGEFLHAGNADNEVQHSVGTNIDGCTNNGFRTILRARSGHSFRAFVTAGSGPLQYDGSKGAAFKYTGSSADNLDITETNVDLELLQFWQTHTYYKPFDALLGSSGTVKDCIFLKGGNSSGMADFKGSAWTVEKTLFYTDGEAGGVYNEGNHTYSRCMFARHGGASASRTGFNAGSGNPTLKGCVSFNFTTDYAGTANAASTNNATSLGSFGGTNYGTSGQTNVSGSDFVDVTTAGLDWRTASGSTKLRGTGVSISGVTTDIFGTTIDGTIEIGVFEFADVVPGYAEGLADRVYAYAEDRGRDTMSSASYSDKVALTWQPNASKDHAVIYCLQADIGAVNSDVRTRLNDDTAAAARADLNLESQDTTDEASMMGGIKFTSGGSPGSQTHSLERSVETGGTTAGFQGAAVLVLELGSTEQVQVNTGSVTTTSGSYVDGVSATLSAGDYLVIGFAEVGTSSVNVGNVRLTDGTTHYNACEPLQNKDTTNFVPWAGMAKVSGSRTMKIQLQSNGAATVTLRNQTLIVLDWSKFQNAQHAEQRTRQTTTVTGSQQDGLELAATGMQPVPHAILMCGMLDHSATNSSARWQAEKDTVGYDAECEREAAAVGAEMPLFFLIVETPTPGSHSYKLKYRAEAGTSGIDEMCIVALPLQTVPNPPHKPHPNVLLRM